MKISKQQVICQIALLILITVSALISFNNPIVSTRFHHMFEEAGYSAAIAWGVFFWVLAAYPSCLVFKLIENRSKVAYAIIYCMILAALVYVPIQVLYLLSQIA